ncbi:MAG: hypothetical protein ACYC46_13165 [Acidobacteriaceae bacterium]
MGLDIRVPLGLMFLIVGGLMTGFGLLTHGSAIYDKSLDMNINLIWGILMLVFGLVMYLLGRRPQTPPSPKVIKMQSRPHGMGH